MTVKCLDQETLVALINDALPETIRIETIQHLDQCSQCQSKIEHVAGETQKIAQDLKASSVTSTRLAEVMADLTVERKEPVRDGDQHLQSLRYAFDRSKRPNGIGRFADHEIEGFLGAGGMGIVLKAFDDSLQRHVAIKLLPPNAATNQESRHRFLREARAAASIDHEHVVTIHAVDEFNSIPYLIMQYVDGESLYLRLQKQECLETPLLVPFATQVASALMAAHRRGIIHRDIKPANILIERETGKALVTDFGLAQTVHEDRLTKTGYAAGTPCFMSPEQAKAEPVDARSDLFSLGAVLYTAATGKVPFEGESVYAVIRNVCESTPESASKLNADVPLWLSLAIEKLMMKDPNQRYQTAKDFFEELKSQSRGATPVYTKDVAPAKTPRQNRSRWALATGLGCVVLALVIAAVVGDWNKDTDASQNIRSDSAEKTSIPADNASEDIATGAFLLVGSSASYETLHDAIEAASDGATIEIRSDGPFEISKCGIRGKSITIQAAKNVSPILSQTEGQIGPAIVAEQGLTLIGLSLGFGTKEPPNANVDRYTSRSSLVAVHGGNLKIENCDFRCLSGGAVIYFAGDQAVFNKSRFWNGFDMAVIWECQNQSKMAIQNCFFDTNLGITIAAALDLPERSFGLDIANNIFRNQFGFNIHSLSRPPTTGDEIPDDAPFVVIHSHHNLFHVNSLINFRANTAASDSRTIKQLKYLVDWRGRQNVYANFECLSSVSRFRLQRYRAVHTSLGEWSREWQERDSAVAAGSFTSLSNDNTPPVFTISEWLDGVAVENVGWQDSVSNAAEHQ